MASPLSSSGVGTVGLDVSAVVTALMKIERAPVTKLDAREKTQNAKISAYGTMKSLIATLQSASAALGSFSGNKFSAFKTTSSDNTKLTASASSSASAANYSINVTSLAQSQNVVAVGQVSKTAAISDGTATTVTFDFGTISGGTLTNGKYTGALFTSGGAGTQNVVIDGTNNTLEGIRDAINTANYGVTASIVNDGSGTPYRLVVAANDTGVSKSIKITTSGGDGTINTLLGYDPAGTQNLTQTAAAQNAVFDVNGVSISKISNSVTDAIEGVSLTLSNVTTSPVNLSIARDPEAVSDAVTAFVKAYNDLNTALKNGTRFKAGSAVEGDITLRLMQTQLRNIAIVPVAGGTLSRLDEVGITFAADGKMMLDSSVFNAALTTDYSDVAHLFNSAGGFATQYESLASTAATVGGTIDARITIVQNEITRIGNERDTLESRLKIIESRYRKQFSNLNVLLTSMNQTSSFLTQQYAALNKS